MLILPFNILIMKKHGFIVVLALLYAGLFNACNKNENARVQFRLTDAPGQYDAVLIDIQQIEVKAGDASFTQTLARPGVYNLLAFSNGLDTLLADLELPEGQLSQIRLILGNNNHVVVAGDTIPLQTPSAQQSGLKLNVQYELLADIDYKFILDFDAGRSIVQQGNGNYSLKPVIRVITESMSGGIRGDANPDSTAVYAMAISGTDTFGTIPALNGQFLIKGLSQGTYQVIVQGNGNNGNVVINNVGVVPGNIVDLGAIQF